MTILNFSKEIEQNINFSQLQRELFVINSATATQVNILVNDELELTQDQKDIIQTVIDNHTPVDAIGYVRLKINDIYCCMQMSEVVACTNLSQLVQLLKSLGDGVNNIDLNVALATGLCGYLATLVSEDDPPVRIVSDQSIAAIKAFLATKGIVVP